MSDGLNWFFVGLMIYGTLALGAGAFIQARLARKRSAIWLGYAATVLALAAIALRSLP